MSSLAISFLPEFKQLGYAYVNPGDEILVPGVMLKADEDLFLDNATPGELSEMLGVKVTPVYVTGYDFIDKLTGREMDV